MQFWFDFEALDSSAASIVALHFGEPRRHPVHDMWVCDIIWEGADLPGKAAYGASPMDALANALTIGQAALEIASAGARITPRSPPTGS